MTRQNRYSAITLAPKEIPMVELADFFETYDRFGKYLEGKIAYDDVWKIVANQYSGKDLRDKDRAIIRGVREGGWDFK